MMWTWTCLFRNHLFDKCTCYSPRHCSLHPAGKRAKGHKIYARQCCQSRQCDKWSNHYHLGKYLPCHSAQKNCCFKIEKFPRSQSLPHSLFKFSFDWMNKIDFGFKCILFCRRRSRGAENHRFLLFFLRKKAQFSFHELNRITTSSLVLNHFIHLSKDELETNHKTNRLEFITLINHFYSLSIMGRWFHTRTIVWNIKMQIKFDEVMTKSHYKLVESGTLLKNKGKLKNTAGTKKR